MMWWGQGWPIANGSATVPVLGDSLVLVSLLDSGDGK